LDLTLNLNVNGRNEVAFNKLTQKQIRKSKGEDLLNLLVAIAREMERTDLPEVEKTDLGIQNEMIRKEMLFRMDSSLFAGGLGFDIPDDLTPAERQFFEDANDIAAENARMSDDEVWAYLEENNLTHLVTAERINAVLAEALGNPKKAARLMLIWDRDKQNPKTED
jgi:hypothetical protein